MAIEDDDRPRKKITHEIGQDLSLLSVEELAERIALMNVGDRAAAGGDDQKARLQGRGEQFFQVVRAHVLDSSTRHVRLVPGIHVCSCDSCEDVDVGTSPGMTRVSELGQWPTWQTKPEKNRSFTID